MSAPVFGSAGFLATDLGSDWEPQGGSDNTTQTRAKATGANGDTVASNTHNATRSGSDRYIYTGAETAFAAALTAATANVGNYFSTAAVVLTGFAVDYSPCAQGKRPVATFTYRDGPTEDCAVYSPSITLPTNPGAVPDLFANSDGDSECQTAQYSLQAQFGEDLDKSGDFLAGNTYDGQESISAQYVGKPTLTTTGWDETTAPGTNGGDQSNTGYGTFSYTYEKSVLRATTTTTGA